MMKFGGNKLKTLGCQPHLRSGNCPYSGDSSDPPRFKYLNLNNLQKLGLGRAIFAVLLWLALFLPVHAQDVGERMKRYADEYSECKNTQLRLKLANDFFAFLHKIDYIDEPIAFPAGAHIDSVDVNVYYYVAEWYYGLGDYQATVDYCMRATDSFGVVDSISRSDVYALMGAAYFRQSAFDKAVEALNNSYEMDKASGDFDRMSSTLNGIASIFVAAGKPEEAEKYILEAIAANSLTENLARRAVLYGTTSEIYRSMDNRSQSLEYAVKALETERLLGDSARIGVRLSQLASAQLSCKQIAAARKSLSEAIPMLQRSDNLHSWGICQNQMGDILASEDNGEEAAAHYLEAAMLFLKMGDKYNELHAREGLYKVMQHTSPSEALMHLERAKLLQDSIYQQETGEALGKYNAIYYNDILEQEKERTERRDRIILVAGIAGAVVILSLITLGIVVILRRHRKKVRRYEQHISTMQVQNEQISRLYQNALADAGLDSDVLTADDKEFLRNLRGVIYEAAEKGITDIDSIADKMHINVPTLRRRLYSTLSITPKDYIRKVRMHKALYLLQNYRDITIAEVAEKSGYTQVSNFTRAFTNYFGIMPTDVKNERIK